MGGQIANSLAGPLKRAGFRVLGTDPDDIDRAEDRHAFSKLLDGAGIHQPAWTEAQSLADVLSFCEQVGFPVLVRPSYVLSGSAMAIATGPDELEGYLTRATESFSRGSVVISRFIEDAKEIELDGIAVGRRDRRDDDVRAHRERGRPFRRRDDRRPAAADLRRDGAARAPHQPRDREAAPDHRASSTSSSWRARTTSWSSSATCGRAARCRSSAR